MLVEFLTFQSSVHHFCGTTDYIHSILFLGLLYGSYTYVKETY